MLTGSLTSLGLRDSGEVHGFAHMPYSGGSVAVVAEQLRAAVLWGWWREPVGMIFGDHVRPADTVASAGWIAGACRGVWWTVGALVPNQYPLILRVHAPDASVEDWWSAYRDLYEIIASIGERHTSSPDRAWFAVWEGHGFDTATTHIAWQGPLDEERSRLRDEDERHNAAIRAALLHVPRFDLPNRTYYLLGGPVTAATQLRHPGRSSDWRNPDLFWPDDRRWFVATDVDFWSLYIGGDDDFITELARNVPTRTEVVTLDRQLEIED